MPQMKGIKTLREIQEDPEHIVDNFEIPEMLGSVQPADRITAYCRKCEERTPHHMIGSELKCCWCNLNE